MPIAIHHHSTLCLNTSNHPCIPPEGLVLEANVPTPVADVLVPYLKSVGAQIQDSPVHAANADLPSNFLES